MDVLNSLVIYATLKGLMQPLDIQQARHRVSFYADDAVLFLRPNILDLVTVRHLLDLFGHASLVLEPICPRVQFPLFIVLMMSWHSL